MGKEKLDREKKKRKNEKVKLREGRKSEER